MLGVAKLAEGVGNIDLVEREPAAVVPPGYVRLEVHAAGICGTDLHIEAGEWRCVPPMTMGHEVCGSVAELGEGVDASWLGERIVSETYYATCGVCRPCRDGKPNLCVDRRSIGTHVDGAFAPSVVVPAHGLHRVPAGLSDAAASMTEPLACCCQALLDPAQVNPGDRVLVVGPGAIGLLAAQVARASGGRVEVRGAPSDSARLAMADRLGFVTSVAGADSLDADGYDVAVDCSGAGPGIADAMRAVRRAGTLVQIGLAGKDVTVPYDLLCLKELTVTTSLATTPASWRRATRLIAENAVALEPLVSEVVALTDFRRAFDASRAGHGVKFVLDPR
jgi:L-iditol 2-dehydrogenase